MICLPSESIGVSTPDMIFQPKTEAKPVYIHVDSNEKLNEFLIVYFFIETSSATFFEINIEASVWGSDTMSCFCR